MRRHLARHFLGVDEIVIVDVNSQEVRGDLSVVSGGWRQYPVGGDECGSANDKRRQQVSFSHE